MTDSDIKALVRKRDGYRCRDCGMTDEDHIEKNGRSLDVHRLLPGVRYSPHSCITLCRACHGKKPRTIEQALFSPESGLHWYILNAYDREDAHIIDRLRSEADRLGIALGAVIQAILRDHFDGHTPDYVI